MTPFRLRPHLLNAPDLALSRTWFEPPRPYVTDMFSVLANRQGDQLIRYPMTHVAPALQLHFNEGAVRACEVYRLPHGKLAMAFLPGWPAHLVISVELSDGTRVHEVPGPVIEARRAGMRSAAKWGVAGVIATAVTASAVVAAAAVLVLLFKLRVALQVPTRSVFIR